MVLQDEQFYLGVLTNHRCVDRSWSTPALRFLDLVFVPHPRYITQTFFTRSPKPSRDIDCLPLPGSFFLHRRAIIPVRRSTTLLGKLEREGHSLNTFFLVRADGGKSTRNDELYVADANARFTMW